MTLLDIALLSTDHDWHHPWPFPLIPLLWLLAFFLIFRFVCWPGGWRGRRGDHTRSARQILLRAPALALQRVEDQPDGHGAA